MASGRVRDAEALQRGLARWVEAYPDLIPAAPEPADGTPQAKPVAARPARAEPLRVVGLTHATSGLANETVLLDLAPDHPGLAVRLPPLEPTFPVYDLAAQAAFQNAVAAAGIAAPAPAVMVDDDEWIGTPFLVMPRLEGRIPGPAPVFDEWLMGAGAAAQRTVHDALIRTLCALHAVDHTTHRVAPVLPGATSGDALRYWGDYVEWAADGSPVPALGDALAWCRANMPDQGSPAGSAPVLLWGDPRLGNLILDERDLSVVGVLDWELAALGPREMDLGWYFGLDAMMDELFGRRVPGFPDRAEALASYETLSGHEVAHLEWHEIFALTRALAINDRQARVAASSGRRYVGGNRAAAAADDPLTRVLLARMEAAG